MEMKALQTVSQVCQDRSRRAWELKAEGKKIIGYLSATAPLELLTALDFVPYRIGGNIDEPVSKADQTLPVSFCPFVRSCFDLACKGYYDFLDGIAGVHYCDAQEKAVHAWKSGANVTFFPYLDVPHTSHAWSKTYFTFLLKQFANSLESFGGKRLSPENLLRSIHLHNEQRRLMRDLYELRKPDPPKISGTEMLKVIIALGSIPVEEGNRLLTELIREIQERTPRPEPKRVRILLWGDCLDTVLLVETIEAYANLVMEDIAKGVQASFMGVIETPDLFDGLADRYLTANSCSRTFREAVVGETAKDAASNLERRFGYLRTYLEQWQVDGVILLLVRYCDPHGYEVPAVSRFLDSIEIPHTYIEHSYSGSALAAIKTRIQAFVEMISGA
jgi:benzoyl-CoA reductase/2-hydroxyglutaryl-CoA dehydratase subunit BcrC/BadD/HgdB